MRKVYDIFIFWKEFYIFVWYEEQKQHTNQVPKVQMLKL